MSTPVSYHAQIDSISTDAMPLYSTVQDHIDVPRNGRRNAPSPAESWCGAGSRSWQTDLSV